jgi:hypothetical protein
MKHAYTIHDGQNLRQSRLNTIKLTGSTIRIGLTAQRGPVYLLSHFDHSRDMFTTRNLHNGIESKISLDDLVRAIADGIAHPSVIPGGIYHGRQH